MLTLFSLILFFHKEHECPRIWQKLASLGSRTAIPVSSPVE